MTFLEFRDAALELTSLIPGCATNVRVEYWRYGTLSHDTLEFIVYVDKLPLPHSAKARTPQLCLTALDAMITEYLRHYPDVDQQADALGELEQPSVANSPS